MCDLSGGGNKHICADLHPTVEGCYNFNNGSSRVAGTGAAAAAAGVVEIEVGVDVVVVGPAAAVVIGGQQLCAMIVVFTSSTRCPQTLTSPTIGSRCKQL